MKDVRTREGALQQGPEGGRTVDDRAGSGAVGRVTGRSARRAAALPGVPGVPADGETAVITRVRAGEAEAYAQLVRAHTGVALRAAIAFGAGADAEDVVRSASFKAYQALGRFRDGASFRPWLLRIVVNETRNTVRSAGRARAVAGREAGCRGAEPLIPESADPAAAALDELSEEQRQVVTYRYLLEMDEAETAEALGRPRGTVKSRLNRALRKLESGGSGGGGSRGGGSS